MSLPINITHELKDLLVKAVGIILNLLLLISTIAAFYCGDLSLGNDMGEDIFAIICLLVSCLGLISFVLKGESGMFRLVKVISFLIYGIIAIGIIVICLIHGLPHDGPSWLIVSLLFATSIYTMGIIFGDFKKNNLILITNQKQDQSQKPPPKAQQSIEQIPPLPSVSEIEIEKPLIKKKNGPLYYILPVLRSPIGIIYLLSIPLVMIFMGFYQAQERAAHIADINATIFSPFGVLEGGIFSFLYYIFLAGIIRSLRSSPLGKFSAGFIVVLQLVLINQFLCAINGIKYEPGHYQFGGALLPIWTAFLVLTRSEDFFETANKSTKG